MWSWEFSLPFLLSFLSIIYVQTIIAHENNIYEKEYSEWEKFVLTIDQNGR